MYIIAIIVNHEFDDNAKTWGIFTLVVSNIRLFSIIARLGFGNSIVRFSREIINTKNKFNNKILSLNELYWFAFILIFIVCLAQCFFFYLFFDEITFLILSAIEDKNIIIYILAGIFPFSLIFLNSGILKGHYKFREFSFFQMFLVNALMLLILVLFSFFKYSIDIILIAYVLCVFIVSFFSFIFLLKKEFIKFSVSFNFKKYYKSLKVSLNLFLSEGVNTLLPLIDILIIQFFANEIFVGQYNIVHRISTLLSLFILAVNHVSMPKMANYINTKKINNVMSEIKKSILLSIMFSAPLFMLILIFPEFIFSLFKINNENLLTLLYILLMVQFINIITGPSGIVLEMIGYENKNRNIVLFATAVKFFILFNCIDKYSILYAIALSNFIYFIIIKFFPLYFIYRLKLENNYQND